MRAALVASEPRMSLDWLLGPDLCVSDFWQRSIFGRDSASTRTSKNAIVPRGQAAGLRRGTSSSAWPSTRRRTMRIGFCVKPIPSSAEPATKGHEENDLSREGTAQFGDEIDGLRSVARRKCRAGARGRWCLFPMTRRTGKQPARKRSRPCPSPEEARSVRGSSG